MSRFPKEVRIEKRLETEFHKFAAEKTGGARTSVLLGQRYDEKYFVVHHIPTPIDNTSGIDTSWVITHLREVKKLVPGGIDVIGILYVVEKKQNSSIEAELLSKLSKGNYIFINADGRKLQSKFIDETSKSRNLPMKYQPLVNKLLRFTAQYPVDFEIGITKNDTKSQKHLLSKFKQLQQSLRNSLIQTSIIIDGAFYSSSSLIETLPESKDSEYFVEFLLPIGTPSLTSFDEEGVLLGALHLKGTITCVTYGSARRTVNEICSSLLEDAITSLYHRCELYLTDKAEASPSALNELFSQPLELEFLPKRVLIPLVDPVSMSEYAFPDEASQEIEERALELFSIENGSGVEQIEQFASADQITTSLESVISSKSNPVPVSSSLSLLFGFALFVAFLALLLAFYYH